MKIHILFMAAVFGFSGIVFADVNDRNNERDPVETEPVVTEPGPGFPEKGWEEVSTDEYIAETESGIRELLTENPAFNQSYIRSVIKDEFIVEATLGYHRVLDYVSYERTTFKWTGETVCEEGDPRLFLTIESGSYCFNNYTCSGLVEGLPVWDPCADWSAAKKLKNVSIKTKRFQTKQDLIDYKMSLN